ncbi:hypothetical protein DPEC_G00280250 [Dallia pectoralis]|uniref:Uncharacterized protein n=1 Tax=Dallia pectoralis TaxID=75939 RepID=A0ACC2FMA4_DALPE|nr:hypothetical protein DPEC_G00280250 [Dallia pectoralis]
MCFPFSLPPSSSVSSFLSICPIPCVPLRPKRPCHSCTCGSGSRCCRRRSRSRPRRLQPLSLRLGPHKQNGGLVVLLI